MFHPDTYGIIEMGLVFGSVLALAVWELVSLRRDRRRSKDQDTTSKQSEKPPEAS